MNNSQIQEIIKKTDEKRKSAKMPEHVLADLVFLMEQSGSSDVHKVKANVAARINETIGNHQIGMEIVEAVREIRKTRRDIMIIGMTPVELVEKGREIIRSQALFEVERRVEDAVQFISRNEDNDIHDIFGNGNSIFMEEALGGTRRLSQ